MSTFLAITITDKSRNLKDVEASSAMAAARYAAEAARKPCTIRIVDSPARASRDDQGNVTTFVATPVRVPKQSRSTADTRAPQELDLPTALHLTRNIPAATRKAILDNLGEFDAWFLGWLDDNWVIWLAFTEVADAYHAQGRRYAAKRIIEELRWETAYAEDGPFKVNNNAAPGMARLFNLTRGEPLVFSTRD